MPHFEIEAKFVVAGYAVMPEHIPCDRRAENCRSLRGDASPETACLAAVPVKEKAGPTGSTHFRRAVATLILAAAVP